MAIVEAPIKPRLLTYTAYLAEGEISERYEIIDGVRGYMPSPKWGHQRIQRRLLVLSAPCEEAGGRFQTVGAPMDVLIQYAPLRTRQPDVLFLSTERMTQGAVDLETGFLATAPEVVVEILSPSDTSQVLADKLADYGSVDVKECWLIHTETQTVEVLRLTSDGTETVATYSAGETVQSLTFAELALAVDAIFAP